MDREREQFFPERGIVKKNDYCDVNNCGLRSQLQKRNWSGEFLSPQKGGNSGKRDRLFSRDGTSEFSKFISGMNYAGTFIHTGTISGTFILRWVMGTLKYDWVGGELIFMSHE